MDKQKHKLYMAQILSLIFKDKDLCNVMGFKGGTALMFFHKLPRFSTDLDFNLLDTNKLDIVYAKVRQILLRFGSIDDEAKKQFGPILVLNYGKGERMLKAFWASETNEASMQENHLDVRGAKPSRILLATCLLTLVYQFPFAGSEVAGIGFPLGIGHVPPELAEVFLQFLVLEHISPAGVWQIGQDAPVLM